MSRTTKAQRAQLSAEIGALNARITKEGPYLIPEHFDRKITRVKDGRFCTLELRLSEGRLSICGVEGYVVTLATARKEALEYWVSFFEGSPAELAALNERNDTRFRSPTTAARYVLQHDGESHGLDVVKETETHAYVGESFGQIRDALREWFPDVRPFLRWHLNDMHAECVHQEERGETYQTHPDAKCPDCGYALGSAWLKRELPPEVVEWARTFGVGEVAS